MDENDKKVKILKKKIKKYWLPLVLFFLILINLFILPSALEASSNTLDTSPLPLSTENSFGLMPPIVTPSKSINQEKEKEKSESSSSAEKITSKDQKEAPVKSSKKIKSLPITEHSQGSGFRFFLFLLTVLLSGLVFSLLVIRSEGNYSYSKHKSCQLEIDPIKEGYSELSGNAYYENI